jgi:hypothetical protein
MAFFGHGHFLIAREHLKHCYWNLASKKIVFEDVVAMPRSDKGNFAVARNEMILAKVNQDEKIVLWELLTGKTIRALPVPDALVLSFSFSRDGLWLASVQYDGTVLCWDWLEGMESNARTAPTQLLWEKLADEAGSAYQAMAAMVQDGKATAEGLKKLLRPVSPKFTSRYQGLIRELEKEENRQVAFDLLREEIKEAEFFIREAHEMTPSKRIKAKLTELLESMPMHYSKPTQIQRLRAIQVLEYIATKDTRAHLDELAQGAKLAPETLFANAALQRLSWKEATEGQDLKGRRKLRGEKP